MENETSNTWEKIKSSAVAKNQLPFISRGHFMEQVIHQLITEELIIYVKNRKIMRASLLCAAYFRGGGASVLMNCCQILRNKCVLCLVAFKKIIIIIIAEMDES